MIHKEQPIDLISGFFIDKELQHSILNTIPVMITMMVPKSKQVIVNKYFEDITGWKNEDSEMLSFIKLIYRAKNPKNNVLKKYSLSKNGFRDVVITTKSGKEIKSSWTNIAFPDGRIIGIGVDISDRVKAEMELRESEEKFRNMADNISQFAWMADSTGWIFWYNKRWYDYTGTTLDDMKGWGWTKVHHPEHVERVKAHFKKSFDSGNNWEDIFPLRSKDGEYRWFLSRAMPIKNENNEIIRWFGTNTDITERKKAEEDLKKAKEKAEKAIEVQTAFVQNISHEVRTPMNSILGFAELLKKNIKSETEAKYLEAINSSGHQLLRLIDDIIDLSRLDKKELTLNFKNISLTEIIEHSKQHFDGLQLTYKKNDLTFLTEMPIHANDIILKTDENRIQQIITNLLSNAIKYTDKGSIELGCSLIENESKVKIYVKDTGIGISNENHSQVFKRFHQFDFSKKKTYGGTGLGLAICKHLTFLFGGVMGFESERGKGSTFYFTHPVHREGGGVQSLEKQQLPKNIEVPDLKEKVVLIAEDDYFSFFMLQSMFAETGAKILHAENGLDAIHLFETNKIDLVFLDIRLPQADGYAILSKIRKVNKDIPVIAQTASALPEDREKSLKAGFTAHTTKPLSMDKLYYLIHKYSGKLGE